MRKITVVFMILCFIIPFAGTYCWLHFKKYKVRKELKWKMIAGVDKNELVQLKFTEKETREKLRWKHSREFEYNGEMYDIVSTEFQGDSIFYWCWWDHEETKLNRQLDKLVFLALSLNHENRDRQHKLAEFMKVLYPLQYFTFNSYNSCEDLPKTIVNITFYISPAFSPPVPPPKK